TWLISQLTSDTSIDTLYESFNTMNEEALIDTSSRILNAFESIKGNLSEEESERKLRDLALQLSLEANAKRIAAKKILDEIMTAKARKEEMEKEKEKTKTKEADKESKTKE
ncbi:MAG: hypothetical protein GX957_15595, partial [Clostridiaceae bacterium]|nr:hypothetical protein [Clostridiaceae bacterium]